MMAGLVGFARGLNDTLRIAALWIGAGVGSPVAIRTPVSVDGPCIFAGETAIFVGADERFDDGLGHLIERDIPLGVCRKTAANLRALGRSDLIVTPPTWHHAGGGCC